MAENIDTSRSEGGDGTGVQAARWSALRNAFLSAVAASKGKGLHQGLSSNVDNNTGTADKEKRFEGFVLFLR